MWVSCRSYMITIRKFRDIPKLDKSEVLYVTYLIYLSILGYRPCSHSVFLGKNWADAEHYD